MVRAIMSDDASAAGFGTVFSHARSLGALPVSSHWTSTPRAAAIGEMYRALGSAPASHLDTRACATSRLALRPTVAASSTCVISSD